MDKLIELLNEYDKEEGLWNKWEEDEQGLNNMWKIYDYHSKLKIISKEYGFIKWLVDNNNIDLDKIEEKSEYTFIKNGGGEHIIEDVLMLLSIQDNPIDFLISILKDKKVRTVYVDEDGNVSGDTKQYYDC